MDPVINLDTEEKEIDRRIEIGVEVFESIGLTTWFERESLKCVIASYLARLDKEMPSLDINKGFNEAMRIKEWKDERYRY